MQLCAKSGGTWPMQSGEPPLVSPDVSRLGDHYAKTPAPAKGGQLRKRVGLAVRKKKPGSHSRHRGKKYEHAHHDGDIHFGRAAVNIHLWDAGAFFIDRHGRTTMDRGFRVWFVEPGLTGGPGSERHHSGPTGLVRPAPQQHARPRVFLRGAFLSPVFPLAAF